METGHSTEMNDLQRMQAIDEQLSHVWMVRTFLKHSDEAAEDEELASVHRDLYDYMLALGPSLDAKDATRYLRLAKKKLRRLLAACELYHEIQPEISGHTNFIMAGRSLRLAVTQIQHWLQSSPGLASIPATAIDDDGDEDDEE